MKVYKISDFLHFNIQALEARRLSLEPEPEPRLKASEPEPEPRLKVSEPEPTEPRLEILRA